MGISLRALLIAGLFGQVSLSLHAQQLLDDFNRPASDVVGFGWNETETATGAVQINASGQLQLGSTINGMDMASRDMTGLYGVRLDTNDCAMTWAFCMRQSRPSPSGFTGLNYAVAFVIGSTTADFRTSGQGYAVVSSTTNGPIRLVRFNNGLAGTLTDLVTTSPTNFASAYLAVRVVYTPGTNNWQLYVNSVSSGQFSSTNPVTAATTLRGSFSNSTYVTIGLPYGGMLWKHNTATGQSALFDNIYVPVLCIPIVNFNSSTSSANENVGSVLVSLNITPASITGGSITLNVADGIGVVYGSGVGYDYFTSPGVSASTITITVPPNSTSVSFTLNVQDPAPPDDEDNEQITFTIISSTGDIVLGSNLVHTFTILDDDGGPTVSFSNSIITVLEDPGSVQTFILGINPPTTEVGVVTISVNPGAGAVCGPAGVIPYTNDFQISSPIGIPCGAATFNVPFPAGVSSISFSVTVHGDNDVNCVVGCHLEQTEQVTFIFYCLSA